MKLPEHILKAVVNYETSLGDNPAFPPGITGGRFVESLLSKRFDEVAKPFNGKSDEEIKSELSKSLDKCKSIERNCKPALEKLCGDLLNRFFEIPEDTVEINLEISERECSQKLRMEPENTDGFSFDSVEDMGSLSYEIYKRRMINALVEGASEYYAYNVGNYVQDLFKINPELPSLYSKIAEASQYLMLSEDDESIQSDSDCGGYVVVKVGQKNDMPRIEACGSIFPILLQQAIKGVLEVSVLGGLPKDKEKARYVMSKADFGMAEKWDSRIGYPLWEKITDSVSESKNDIEKVGYNFVLMELSNATTAIFNETLQEVFAGTKKGVRIMKAMCNYINEQRELDKFNDYIDQTNSKFPIEDGYFTAEELIRDLPVLQEDLKKGDSFSLNGLKPEQLAKMIAAKYGVSPSDFAPGKNGTLTYQPKHHAKPKKEVVSKPEGMSVDEYKYKYVIPMKPELKDEEGEEWRPVPNKGRYFGGDVDYSNYYEISNLGRLRMIDFGNAARSTISCGYDAPTRKAMQFHLNHKSGMNTCPDVKYMVADAFLGEHDLDNNMVVHIDGDYHNNRADNLKWVPRKRK